MSRLTWIYIWSALLTATAMSGFALSQVPLNTEQWLLFGVLTGLATVAQLFKVEAPNHQTYFTTPIFLFAGVLLLHPAFFALTVFVSYMLEWGKERLIGSHLLRKWYLQPFNIATHIIAGFAAHWVYIAINQYSDSLFSPVSVAAVVAAALTYALVNHALVGQALVLARKVSWRESGVFEFENLLTEVILLFMGAVVSVLLRVSPWLVLPALSPLVLVYKALTIPQLRKDAQTDGKTGLLNARHFTDLFTGEMTRAQRHERPMALIMADLDLLRNINNTYGHLAGDKVLSEIGKIIKSVTREYDLAGRFGGEEFAIVLPETEPEEARAIAERLRGAVERAGYEIATSATPIHVTMSIGISCYPQDAANTTDLLHEADVAVYRAKLNGRNCVVCASDVPQSVELAATAATNSLPAADRLASPYSGNFTPRPIPTAHTEASTSPNAPQAGSIVAQSAAASPIAPVAPLISTQVEGSNKAAIAVVTEVVETNEARETKEAKEQPTPTTAKARTSKLINLYVGSVIVAGLAVGAVGSFTHTRLDIVALVLLVALAAIAELLQVNLYGPDTLSVSAAALFAAALVCGVPGVVCVSAAIALIPYIQHRPAFYKTVFNWSTHVLAGSAPALALLVLGLDMRVENLAILAAPLAIAALSSYIIDTGLIATAIAISSGSNPFAVWRERFRWIAGHYLVLCVIGVFLGTAYAAQGWLGVVVFALPVFMMRYSQKQYIERTEDSMRELQRMNQELTHANQEVVAASLQMAHLNEELFLTLSKMIDARDPYVGGHASKVADYALAIAGELGLPSERIEPLRQGGFLHDIGKIAISEQILHKPSKLTNEEYEIIKTHAAIGAEFLETSQVLRHLAPFVRHHHERWDGGGYPDKLKGDEIPLEARILSVCDSAEAMASDRPYHKGMAIHEVIAEIQRCAGTQFDPTVAEAFVQVVEREQDRLMVNSAQEVLLRRQAADNKELKRLSGPLAPQSAA